MNNQALAELRQTREEIDAVCAEIHAKCRELCPELFDRLGVLLKREENLQAVVLTAELAKD